MRHSLPTLIGVAEADDSTIASLRISSGGAGFMLGTTTDDQQVVVQLFGPEPINYAVVGGLPLRQMLVFRALALGVQVIVKTHRPETWGSFVRIAGGMRGDLHCVTDLGELPHATPRRPVLVVLDSDSSLGGSAVAPGPWTAVISATDHATQWNADELARVDVVFAQSLSSSSAKVLATALTLPDNGAGLVGLQPNQVSLAARGALERVDVTLTQTERWITGARNPMSDGVQPELAG